MKHTFIVYKTICTINNKEYIGIHKNKSSDPLYFDGYYGSGYLLNLAIKKYGIENFKRETLYHFSTWEECRQSEKELVTKDYIDSGVSYNVALGGQGGNTSYGRTIEQKKTTSIKSSNSIKLSKLNISNETKKLMSISAKKRVIEKPHTLPNNKNRVYSENGYKNILEANQKRIGNLKISNGILEKEINQGEKIPEGWYFGRKHNYKKFESHTEESKKKISTHKNILGVSCYNNGTKNIKVPHGELPPDGFVKGLLIRTLPKKWINNGIIEKTIPKDEEIQDGFTAGRLYKKRNSTKT